VGCEGTFRLDVQAHWVGCGGFLSVCVSTDQVVHPKLRHPKFMWFTVCQVHLSKTILKRGGMNSHRVTHQRFGQRRREKGLPGWPSAGQAR
jgi:hypothetical protein